MEPEAAPDAPTPPAAPGPAGLSVDLRYDAHVSYALQQNGVPVVKALRLLNAGAHDLLDLEVSLWAEPGLAPRVSRAVPRLPAGAALDLTGVDLSPRAERLLPLRESERGTLHLEVTRGGTPLLAQEHPLTLLAPDEWAGRRSLPEILAAFVEPNHPAVEALLREACARLARATGDPALDGYQRRDPGRVRAVVASLVDAVAARGLAYAEPPASFEREGQKVRGPGRVLETGLGTCLDLSLLLASLLEQAGLNPLLVLLEGHALVGCWLTGDTLPQPLLDVGLRLRKRADVGDVLLLEATGVTARPPLSFEEALAAGRHRLDDLQRFAYALDVKAARRAGIRPRPSAIGPGEARDPAAHAAAAAAPGVPVPSAPVPAAPPGAPEDPEAPRTPEGRLERWKRRLLDLSLRNPLLNHRVGRRAVVVRVADPAALEDALAGGKRLRLVALPVAGPADPRDRERLRTRSGDDPDRERLIAELAQGRLALDLDEAALLERLTLLDRAARLSLEEGGANTLFLALGFLTWTESETSAQVRRAPLLLVPVRLTRVGASSEFRIEHFGDDTLANVALLQKLRVDFGLAVDGVEDLVADEAGVDVRAFFERVRRLVLPLERFDVSEDAALGLFSFSKYLMWLDLERSTERLRAHPVVRHLLDTPNQGFDAGGSLPDPATLDRSRPVTDALVPLEADSSQLAAVAAAVDGRTFVLEGPPGTGKSQTITNLIARSLAAGRRVLFVSEKMAALEVVHRRLTEIGLAPWCLELHSTKAQKGRLVSQLREALEAGRPPAPAGYEEQAARLGAQREALNGYVERLHAPQPLGLTPHQALARLSALGEAARLPFEVAQPAALTAQRLADALEAAEDLARTARGVGDPAASPWAGCDLVDWLPGTAARVGEVARALAGSAARAGEAARALAQGLGLSSGPLHSALLDDLVAAAALLAGPQAPPAGLLLAADPALALGEVSAWTAAGQAEASGRAALLAAWDEALLQVDPAPLEAALRRAAAAPWPLSWWRARAARRALAPWRRDGRLPGREALRADLAVLARVRAARATLAAAEAPARALLGADWAGLATDWERLPARLEAARTLGAFAERVAAAGLAAPEAVRRRLGELLGPGRDQVGPGGPLGLAARRLADLRQEGATGARELEALLRLTPDVLAAGPGRDEAEVRRRRAEGFAGALPGLKVWCAWRAAVRAAGAAGLAGVVGALEQGRVDAAGLRLCVERSALESWLEALLAADPELSRVTGSEQSERVRRFRELDLRLVAASRDAHRAAVAARGLPAGEAAASAPESELGQVRRLAQLKRPRGSIRSILARIPNALARLKPCVLMSPLSVAHYLVPETPPFDLVVFDEASQIPTWDAVGAISRGRALVVVGDGKQLPPTTFFQRLSEGAAPEEAEEEVEDLESVLTELTAAGLPSLQLAWHYRSRHEHLIAFSNRHYYRTLFTFPAADDLGGRRGVRWVPVPGGVYDRGGNATNRAEAEALVAELVRRLKDPVERARTLGVVTFSAAQQTLVEDLLDEARRAHPEIEGAFDEEHTEPVFVKNLENVQGDERDVILISVCYGPDREGRVAMNFGPLNQEGGERRLNVVVTRAREQVVVFSTLRADQIDLSRTHALGVQHLRAYLEFAERGPAALGTSEVAPGATPESPLEAQVGAALVARGWRVVPQVGCSGYRVDLGVLHPERPGRFLLGVECDGAMYHAAHTARDRDRLRAQVLGRLGWRLARVWSTDWWSDRERVLADLDRALKEALASGAVSEAEPVPPAPAAPEPPPVAVGEGEPRLLSAPTYTLPRLPVHGGGPDALCEPRQGARIGRLIESVLAAEAPLALPVLCRRVAAAFDVARVTERVRARVESLVPAGVPRSTGPTGVVFLWRRDAPAGALGAWRGLTASGEAPRGADEIPPEEIALAARDVLTAGIALPADALARETARRFGLLRLGPHVLTAMSAGIDVLVLSGQARRDGERILLP